MKLRVLSADDVRRALPMRAAVDGMKRAFEAVSTGTAKIPLRSKIELPQHPGVSLFMPAWLPGPTDELSGATACKVVSVFDENQQRGLPTIMGLVMLLEAETGRPLAVLEGGTLTAIRTGAASGAATELLANPDARTAAIFGSGVQARTQLEAVCTVRDIVRVLVYSPTRAHAETFAAAMAGQGPIPRDVVVAETPAAAVREADIICTATTSRTPVFEDRDVRQGAHINAVGSYMPHVQETPAETVCRALVVVDSRESALEEAGDLLVPMAAGAFSEDQIHAELGEIVAGTKPGRSSAEQITFFKSCGIAVQDTVSAELAFIEAELADLGTVVEL